MKTLATIIGLGIVGLMAILYVDNREAIGQATTQVANNAALSISVLLWLIPILATLSVVVILAMAYKARSVQWDNDMRQRDGSHALREYRLRRPWWNPLSRGVPVLVNPDNMVSAAAVIDDDYGYVELAPAAGWEIQAQIRNAVQATHSLQAMNPGDAAITSQYGSMYRPGGRPGIPNVATGKFLSGSLAPDAPPAPPALLSPYTAGKALNESTADALILGQADNGKLCKVNLRQAVNVGIVGAPGTGKTASSGFHLALALRKAGARLAILDPKGGVDWRPFARVAEWRQSDYTVIRDQMSHVYAEYEQRAAIVQRAGVSHLMELRDPSLPPLVVIVEEYGDLCRELRGRGKGGDVDAMDNMIDTIISKGRYTDVHFVLIDQYPEAWSKQVMMATKAKIIYQVGPNQGTLVGDWHAQTLPDSGVFRYQAQQFNAWHIRPNLPAYLAALPAYPYPALIDGSVVRSSTVGGGSTTGSTPTEPPTELTPNRTTEPEETVVQRRAKEMIDADPGTRQVDLVTALGVSKVYAHELWHTFHPAGKMHQPDPPAAVDAFGRQRTVIRTDDPGQAEALAAIRVAIESGQAHVKGGKS